MKEAFAIQRVLDPSLGSNTKMGSKTLHNADPTRRLLISTLPLSPALREQQSQALRKRICQFIEGKIKIHVTITDNRSVMVSVQRDPRHAEYHVRLHHLFIDAPEVVIQSLADYILQNDRPAAKELNQFIENNQHRIRPPQPEKEHQPIIRTKGRHYDLQSIFDETNARYFNNQACCKITWGRNVGQGKARRSIKLGSFSLEENLIRIHPGLDQEWIPRFYIEWVIYHEMLHAVYPAPIINGRHQFHSADFNDEERRFLEYAQATTWEKRNIAALLSI